MMTIPNDAFGTTLLLSKGDDLDDVPESHQDMITESIKKAFQDPVAHFSERAARTTIPNLQRYLNNGISGDNWLLLLADANLMERSTIAGFQWFHPDQRQCIFGLPDKPCTDKRFSLFCDDFQFAHWDQVGWSGGIFSHSKDTTIDQFNAPSTNPIFPADSTIVFGNSSCGDMMVVNESGQAGYLSHEDGASYVIGSLPEMLDWVFGELLQNREPEFDYSRG